MKRSPHYAALDAVYHPINYLCIGDSHYKSEKGPPAPPHLPQYVLASLPYARIARMPIEITSLNVIIYIRVVITSAETNSYLAIGNSMGLSRGGETHILPNLAKLI